MDLIVGLDANAAGEQTIDVIVDHGYRPHSIVARAGVPIRLVFRREDTDECTDRVVFSSPRVERRLARGTATTIVLPPQPPGEIRFACGMGRYHGQIELKADRQSLPAELRATLGRWRGSGWQAGGAADRQVAEKPKGNDKESRTMTLSQPTPTTRADRRAALLEQRKAGERLRPDDRHRARLRRREWIRKAAFGLVAVAVLGAGVYLAAGDLFGQRGSPTTAEAIPVRLSMAGFTPSEIRVPAGRTVSLELWTTDAAPHLDNGVHTLISDELGIYEELRAAGPTGESRRVVQVSTPIMPGTYDIYCDTCCGGKDSPTMHGKLTVEA